MLSEYPDFSCCCSYLLLLACFLFSIEQELPCCSKHMALLFAVEIYALNAPQVRVPLFRLFSALPAKPQTLLLPLPRFTLLSFGTCICLFCLILLTLFQKIHAKHFLAAALRECDRFLVRFADHGHFSHSFLLRLIFLSSHSVCLLHTPPSQHFCYCFSFAASAATDPPNSAANEKACLKKNGDIVLHCCFVSL